MSKGQYSWAWNEDEKEDRRCFLGKLDNATLLVLAYVTILRVVFRGEDRVESQRNE